MILLTEEEDLTAHPLHLPHPLQIVNDREGIFFCKIKKKKKN